MKKLPEFEQNTPAIPPALRNYPSKLFVETTTSCNLGCFMCVKQTGDCGIIEGEMPLKTFAALEAALPRAEALILNGVGEPLLHPQLETFIARAKKLMPSGSWVGFQSNGLLLNDLRARALLEAGLDRICISVDAVTPEMLRKMREGAEITGLGRAFEALTKAKVSVGRPDFQIGVEIVIMRSNLAELPDTLKWAASRGATFALVSHVLPYAEKHAAESVYESCSGQAISLLYKWREKAAAVGVNIDQYPRIVWNYTKSPAEQKVVEFVDKLKADAEQQQVFLDMKKLFLVDTAWLKKVDKIFTEAARIAKKEGLELNLPEVVLKENRRCEFVEDGSAFFSWQGDVHPCYFLWHNYHCFASGWAQQVRSRVFGNLNDQPILEIWNSPEFKTFRENVTRYDYPYCSGCGLAPCDYVQTEKFEQDCHINSEPCGSCLWCMGLFQCLR
ncbi:radical SAM/SPASM family putative metalloenzyme maturase [Geopsychrobacter electrodiphilus]|uniref:radical SAM/SPASM family putative metalloenzyme maturase n=1 Tax=Geopsychrobacter electrodiphilus TaxID=225196 RepID=UPI00036FAEE4|nr:radical SAM/SPASM family putative metalloenzyme maturase [Geopsychrobacter electrodiphilus]